MKTLTLILLSLVLFSTCSQTQHTVRKEDCQSLNWLKLGQIEGAKGLSIQMLDYHIKRCPPEIESAARSQYIKGHQQGVPNYCTYRAGFIKGEVKDPVPSLCQSPKYIEFHKGYKEGLKASSK